MNLWEQRAISEVAKILKDRFQNLGAVELTELALKLVVVVTKAQDQSLDELRRQP